MKHSTKSLLTALPAMSLLIAMGIVLFAFGQPTKVLAQTTQEATATPAAAESVPINEVAALELTTTLTSTGFDNQIFILSLAVRPNLFVNCVNNPFYPLIPGTVYHYEKETEEGLETTTVTVTNQTKQVMGIAATVVHDTVLLEGEVKEDTFDWYAQDQRGNVWYLGEETAEYENGEVTSTEGSWQAGINGAVPGIVMLDNPVEGDLYRQEYLEDEATDMAAVLSLNEALSLPLGDFENLLVTADYNPLSGELEYKFYAAGIGTVAESPVDTSELTQLVAITHDTSMQAVDAGCGEEIFVGSLPVPEGATNLQELAQVSAGEAEEIALAGNPGAAVIETEIEVKNGFLVYDVELNDGTEVIIDAGDATLLATVSEADEEGDAEESGEADDESETEEEITEEAEDKGNEAGVEADEDADEAKEESEEEDEVEDEDEAEGDETAEGEMTEEVEDDASSETK